MRITNNVKTIIGYNHEIIIDFAMNNYIYIQLLWWYTCSCYMVMLTLTKVFGQCLSELTRGVLPIWKFNFCFSVNFNQVHFRLLFLFRLLIVKIFINYLTCISRNWMRSIQIRESEQLLSPSLYYKCYYLMIYTSSVLMI